MTFIKVLPRRIGNSESKSLHTQWIPPVDIIEGKDGFTIEFDLPGFEKDEIKVSVKEGELTVSGERKPTVAEGETYFRNFERPEGKFSRSFRLPKHTDSENIRGSYHNGILTFEIPKKEEAKSRTIEVK